MPVHVTIAINAKPVQNVTIWRTEKFKGPDFYHQYGVLTTSEDGETAEATFSHLYRNGVEECVRRGLEALANAREVHRDGVHQPHR
jgi:hypothetical protein